MRLEEGLESRFELSLLLGLVGRQITPLGWIFGQVIQLRSRSMNILERSLIEHPQVAKAVGQARRQTLGIIGGRFCLRRLLFEHQRNQRTALDGRRGAEA